MPLDPATTTQILEVATGFFFIMWIVALGSRGKKKERRYYVSKIPSELVIEHEA